MKNENSINISGAQPRLSSQQLGILAIHAFIGWALCAAAMGISMATTTEQNALIIHAIGAPIFYYAVSRVYFDKFNYTTPLQTGLIFVSFVILMDFFVVALLMLQSFDMFASLLGTWIPFALIFTSTYLNGVIVNRKKILV